MQFEHAVVLTTIDSEEAARAISDGVVAAGLGACAQIVGPITSVYQWEGEVRADLEWRIEVKTAADRVEALIDYIRERHSYDVPEVIATPITGGNGDYLDWLRAETRAP